MKKLLVLSAVTFASFATQAEVRINGFANLIGGITSSDDSLYGYDDNVSFSEESVFAIQVSGDINSKMTATGQIVARGNEDYDAAFEWAYLTYAATDNLSISAGRLRLPLFTYSASLDVGYSYHWVNAPRSVYNVAFNNIDGIRFDYGTYSGDWEYNFQVALGKIESKTGESVLTGNNTAVFSAQASYEWFKVRGVYGRAKTTFDTSGSTSLAGLNDLLNTLVLMNLTSLADDLQIRDDTGEFLGFGIEADLSSWFISAEITSITTEDSFAPKDVAYYITGGLRLGAFTPTFTYESFDGNDDIKFLDKVAALPAQLQGPAGAIVSGLQASQMNEFDVVTLGLRYDYDTNIALKADISKYSDDLNESNDATLVRFGVNYVF